MAFEATSLAPARAAVPWSSKELAVRCAATRRPSNALRAWSKLACAMPRTSFGISNLPLPLSPMSQFSLFGVAHDDSGLTIRARASGLDLDHSRACANEAIAPTSDPIVTDPDHLANNNLAPRRGVPGAAAAAVKVIRRQPWTPRTQRFTNKLLDPGFGSRI